MIFACGLCIVHARLSSCGGQSSETPHVLSIHQCSLVAHLHQVGIVVATVLTFPPKGPGTPARKDAINVTSQQKATVWKLKLLVGWKGEGERARVMEVFTHGVVLVAAHCPGVRPTNALGSIMGAQEAECAFHFSCLESLCSFELSDGLF